MYQASVNPLVAARAMPIVAVDDVTTVPSAAGFTITARKTIGVDDPHLDAHFPTCKVFPGVFLIEALEQAVAVALGTPAVVVQSIRSIRFTAPLRPGDVMSLHITATRSTASGLFVDATAVRDDGQIAARIKVELIGSVNGAPEGDEVRAMLPHGYPMVLIDRVEALEPGRLIRAIKAITCTEPCFHSVGSHHGRAGLAYPTSMVLESFGQAAALLWMASGAARTVDDVVVLAGARGCRIEGSAYPGDVLRHEARIDYATDSSVVVSGAIWVGDRRLADIESMTACFRSSHTLAATANLETTNGISDR
jgi:3-hydroxyacyl-[acyl-carrier-protein] dehydratase